MISRTGSFMIWLSAFAVIAVLTTLVWSAVASATDGGFAYILDDPYIHMAMARNLAESAVWGVTRYEFSGASSSMVWIGLLAFAETALPRIDLVPLFLNLTLAAVFIAVAQHYLQKRIDSPFKLLAILIAIVISTPAITLIFLGMEHLLQSVLAVIFVFHAARYVAREDSSTNHIATLVVLAAFTTAVRYEGLFQIAAVGLFLVLRKRFVVAALIGVAGILTPVLYGLYSVSQGWPALPTPILMKGSLSALLDLQSPGDVLAGLEYIVREKYVKHIHMPILIVFAAVAYWRNRRDGVGPFALPQVLLGLYLLIAIQHVHLAGLGWYFRYEAYLVALGGILIARHCFGKDGDGPIDSDAARFAATGESRPASKFWKTNWKRRLLAAVLLVCAIRLVFSMGWRAFVSVAGLPGSAREIYTQQIQSARFFQRYYTGQKVAANDIGAINYYSDIQCVDLFGLASHEVARLRKTKNFTTAAIDALTKREGVRIAIVYDEWFERAGGLPTHWRKAGEWTIPERTTVAQDTVSIYAVTEDYDVLVKRLREFGASMPKEIVQNVPYRP
ncbi:MAG: hypothetical protein RIF32_05505 [Leptospirales bacterium]